MVIQSARCLGGLPGRARNRSRARCAAFSIWTSLSKSTPPIPALAIASMAVLFILPTQRRSAPRRFLSASSSRSACFAVVGLSSPRKEAEREYRSISPSPRMRLSVSFRCSIRRWGEPRRTSASRCACFVIVGLTSSPGRGGLERESRNRAAALMESRRPSLTGNALRICSSRSRSRSWSAVNARPPAAEPRSPAAARQYPAGARPIAQSRPAARPDRQSDHKRRGCRAACGRSSVLQRYRESGSADRCVRMVRRRSCRVQFSEMAAPSRRSSRCFRLSKPRIGSAPPVVLKTYGPVNAGSEARIAITGLLSGMVRGCAFLVLSPDSFQMPFARSSSSRRIPANSPRRQPNRISNRTNGSNGYSPAAVVCQIARSSSASSTRSRALGGPIRSAMHILSQGDAVSP